MKRKAPNHKRNRDMVKQMFPDLDFSEFEEAHVAKMLEPFIDMYHDLGCDEEE